MSGQNTVLKFIRLTEMAFSPVRGSKLAAGLDLRSAYECTVPARGHVLVLTDLQIEVPEGSYGRIAARSGLCRNHGIDVGAGVIDADYRGNVGVLLFNHSDKEYRISRGDRIAQLICERIEYPEPVEVKTLNDTERGTAGFGSTGIC